MSEPDFGPIAATLRQSVLGFYRARGEDLVGEAGHNTLETNSGFVERRGRPLLDLIRERAGVESLDGLRLVDLGAGFGVLSLYFALHGAKVTAVDLNSDRFTVGREAAERHGLSVRFRRGRIECLRLADERFDLALHNNSFCYVVERRARAAGLRETLRVLRPGGWLIVRNPNRWNPLDQFTGLPLVHLLPPEAATRLTSILGRPRSRVRLLSPPGALRELRRAGFVEVAHNPPLTGAGPELHVLFARYQHVIARRPPTLVVSASPTPSAARDEAGAGSSRAHRPLRALRLR